MKELIKNLIEVENKKLFKSLSTFDSKSRENFINLCTLSIKAIKNGNKIIFYGNGGSASDSQHLATELVVRYQKNRPAISSIALSSDNSMITAIANDFHFKKIFSRQLESIGRKGDICIALTTSGNSINLIEAAKVSKKKGILTFCFSGNKGGKIKKFTKYPIIIDSKIPSVIQVIELHFGQIFCGILENSLSK
jgi:D-sedoheptulose 7-phosphate isomerase|tara:strand:- start:771 stop:1352 length:582 start_codon:yes stop_codon:yes gene_type:complete